MADADMPVEDGRPMAVASAIDPALGEAALGVVLVCWNGWEATIECLESLLRSDIALKVVVVDNASPDGSLDRIEAWARGDQSYVAPTDFPGGLSTPPLAKPLSYARVAGEDHEWPEPRLLLVDSGANLGFAGGNNLGMRMLFADPAIEGAWLLNNDTVVEPAAARAVCNTLRSDKRIGMVGTMVRYYYKPETVQAMNGMKFNLWTGMAKAIGGGAPVSVKTGSPEVLRQTDFVLGASLAVSRRFVAAVGMMSEAYFLYYEEIDWATRNRGRFRIGFARGATVFHKHGGAIGSSSVKGGRSVMSDYWMLRSRLKFYGRHYPAMYPLIWAQGVAQTGIRLLRRQPRKASAMAKALLGRSL